MLVGECQCIFSIRCHHLWGRGVLKDEKDVRMKSNMSSGTCVGNLVMVCSMICWMKGISGRSSSCEGIYMYIRRFEVSVLLAICIN